MEIVDNLDQALVELSPRVTGEFVFVSLDSVPADLDVFASIQEDQGVTVIMDAQAAKDRDWEEQPVFAKITCGAPTALTSVGLTAMITQTIASRGIPCNVIAGFHHDHLFVPTERSAEVLGLLQSLSEQAVGWAPDSAPNGAGGTA